MGEEDLSRQPEGKVLRHPICFVAVVVVLCLSLRGNDGR